MNNTLSFYVQRYFISHLIGRHNYGKNTVSSYRDTFKLLQLFLNEHGRRKKNLLLSEVDKDCVVRFLEWLDSTRGNSPATRNVRLAHLKSFFHYVQNEEPSFAWQCEKVMNIPFAKVEKHAPVYMNEDSVSCMLHSINSETKEGLRHLAILSLLYDSGCRVQELIDLKVKDVQFEKGQRIYVHGKGNKYREIPITPATEKILKKYLKAFPYRADELLFTNRKGEALTRQGIRYILQKYAAEVDDPHVNSAGEKIHPHLLRHSKATHLVNAGINIFNIRDFLGHSSVVTTQVYLTSNPEITRKAIEKTASKTVPESMDYYSTEEKQSLMEFLETLI
ncbi:MAG: tyrosine-type recombinase/integrase [Aeriscardovia sp.]|nr:tyrosine-type recombinase/integrase [Aeriscardovia sp.]